MNTRQALLAAADRIERQPYLYDFFNNGRPSDYTPGCMISWAGRYAGVGGDYHDYAQEAARALVGPCGLTRFLVRLLRIAYGLEKQLGLKMSAKNPAHAVLILRAYADRYHPASPEDGFYAGVDPAYAALREQLNTELTHS